MLQHVQSTNTYVRVSGDTMEVIREPLTYEETVKFHGHDGPFLALGYRMGLAARELLNPQGIMELQVTVKVRTEKPYTCIVDGIQCATKATIGKGNIEIEPSPSMKVRFNNRRTGKVVEFVVHPELIKKMYESDDLKAAAKFILTQPDTMLWEVHSVDR